MTAAASVDRPTRESVVFFHAHPDDEAIFTGGTIAALATQGHHVVVVVATGGEGGTPVDGTASLGRHRAAETRAACAHLGVARVEFLGYRDSGIAAPGEPLAVDSFALADVETAARRLAAILADERAGALVHDDEGGIYGHADHLAVHRIGRRAAELAGIATVYEATVDREYLHFVETHLVSLAALSLPEPAPTGVPTVLLTTTIDVTAHLATKRAAMAAHASQIPPDSAVLGLDPATFAAVYGYEWYVRTGPPGLLDRLAM